MISILVRFISGHNFLKRHNKLVDPQTGSAICRFCAEEDETGDHIINRCPKFAKLRYELLGLPETDPEDWRHQDLVNFLKRKEVQALEQE